MALHILCFYFQGSTEKNTCRQNFTQEEESSLFHSHEKMYPQILCIQKSFDVDGYF